MSDDFPKLDPDAWRVAIVARQYISAIQQAAREAQAGGSRAASEKKITQYKGELEKEVATVLGLEVDPASPKGALRQVEDKYGADKAREFRTAYIDAIKKAEDIWKMGRSVSSASSLH